jgi:hypothetical protein
MCFSPFYSMENLYLLGGHTDACVGMKSNEYSSTCPRKRGHGTRLSHLTYYALTNITDSGKIGNLKTDAENRLHPRRVDHG